MTKSLSDMTDEELAAVAAGLAAQRTEIRQAQVAVQREQEVRAATANLSPETRRIVQIGLAGGLKAEGDVNKKEASE